MPASTPSSERLTHFLLAALALGVWGLLLKPHMPFLFSEAQASSKKEAAATFDTLTVQRINIADAAGKTRLIIANSERFPDVEINGKVYVRSIHDTAGLLFFDPMGRETGGLALTKLRDDNVANLTFDYTYQLTDGIRMIKQESSDGTRWKAGFDIYDRRAYQPGHSDSSQGIQRISLTDENQDAHLVISDTEGHPRIRIGVDKTGTPSIEMLGKDGKINYRTGE
ncbi:MAG TPA: hypothetical protein VHW71_07150 [Steroidobacteraceae bacterium]|nr:hypothetical protein [Steroidobacteraceae bacterium]